MKITVFTSNQPRHLSLVEKLASIADTVFVIQECNTAFPGKVADFTDAIASQYLARALTPGNVARMFYDAPRRRFMTAQVA